MKKGSEKVISDGRDNSSGNNNNNNTSSSASNCSSTAAMTPMTAVTTTAPSQVSTLQRRQQRYLHQSLALAGVSSSSLLAFLIIILPPPALIALAVSLASACLMLVTLANNLQLTVQRMIQEGQGIGDYLPPSIYNQLVNITLHEWLHDPTFTLEYRHLLLYFVPGITSQQLDNYVDRLSPSHRNTLRRRGLGHFLGEGFMQVLMGQVRYEQHMRNQPVATPTTLILPIAVNTSPSSAISPSGEPLMLENESQLGLESRTSDDDNNHRQTTTTTTNAGNVLPPATVSTNRSLPLPISSTSTDSERPTATQQSPTRTAAAAAAVNNSDTINNNDNTNTRSLVFVETDPETRLAQEREQEGNLLNEAFATMTQSFVMQARDTASDVVQTTVERFSPVVIRSGLGITAASAGFGLFGFLTGVYSNDSSRSSSMIMSRYPLPWFWLETSIFGGLTAGMTYMVRAGVRYILAATTTTTNAAKRIEGENCKESKKQD